VTESADPEQIREQIEATREDLGDTVAALSEKADVKTQARHKIEATKASVSEKKEQLLGKAKETSPDAAVAAASQASLKARENPAPLAVAGAFAAGFLAGRAFRR
jgi:chromosome segregation ATPase